MHKLFIPFLFLTTFFFSCSKQPGTKPDTERYFNFKADGEFIDCNSRGAITIKPVKVGSNPNQSFAFEDVNSVRLTAPIENRVIGWVIHTSGTSQILPEGTFPIEPADGYFIHFKDPDTPINAASMAFTVTIQSSKEVEQFGIKGILVIGTFAGTMKDFSTNKETSITEGKFKTMYYP